MKTVGLVTEYNPFHNGHLHHLQQSLRTTGAEASVAVMSGHFLQRGELSLVDKWVRTDMALAAGVDLVLELPFPFSCNSAPHFARGAIQALDGLGIVDALCFGSEAGSLDQLHQAAHLLLRHADEIEACTAQLLRQGVSYPAARSRVVSIVAPECSTDTLAAPNNVLGVEYLRALIEAGSSIQPATIPRLGPGFHDTTAVGRIASATGIRQMLAEDRNIQPYLPDDIHVRLLTALENGLHPDQSKLFSALLTILLQNNAWLPDIYQVEHGLENRLAEAALTAKDFADLAATVKSRQWTLTRIQRILIYVLLRAAHNEMTAFITTGPLYLRVLGLSDTGRRCLAKARSERSLPVIMDPVKGPSVLRKFYGANTERSKLAEAMLDLDLRATRIYTALAASPWTGHRNRDFFESVRRGN